MSVYDEPKHDCHCHLFDPLRYPYRAETPYRPSGQEIATLEQMNAVFAAYGVQRALLVQPNSGYDTDLSCMLDAIAASEGQFKGVAVVPLDISATELVALRGRGIVGVGFNPAGLGLAGYDGAGPLLEKLAALGLLLQVQVQQDQILELLVLLRTFPGRLLIDHCGRPDIGLGIDALGFQALLALGREGRTWVKLSGYAKFSREPWPHRDTWPFVLALKAAFGVERCLWASDWPFIRAPERVDYGPLVRLVAMLFPARDERARVFWGNAAELFGFEAVG
ncbi:MAG TPA: amidohydrolase family protein [Acetobacteraceae bacterium]|nr:amidohydrolase family protein [Acetobacteraceae bacterium]